MVPTGPALNREFMAGIWNVFQWSRRSEEEM
jgi:hypothetical protein